MNDCLITEEDIDKEAVFKMAGELKECGGLPVMLERYARLLDCALFSPLHVCLCLHDENVLCLRLCEL